MGHLQKVNHLREKVPVVGLGGVGKNLLLRKLVLPQSLQVAMVEVLEELEEETVGQVVLVNTINMMKTMTFL